MYQSGGERRRSRGRSTGKPKRKSPRRPKRSRRQRRVRSRRVVKGRKDKMLGHLPLGEEVVVEELPKRVQARQLRAQRPLGNMPSTMAPRPRGSAATPPPTPSSPLKFRVVSPSKTSEPQPEPTAEEGEMEHGVSEFAALSMGEVSDALIDGRPDKVIEWLKNNNIDAKGQTPYLIKHLLYILEGEEPRPYPINILDKRGTMFKTIFLAFRLEAISVKNIMRILTEADIQFPKEDHKRIKELAAGVPRRSSVSDADRYKVALVQILLSNPRGREQLFKEEMQPDRDKLPRSKSAYINKTITHLGEANEEAEKPPSDWDMGAFKKLVERKARHRSGTSGTAKKFAVINGILAYDKLKNYVDKYWADIAPYLKD